MKIYFTASVAAKDNFPDAKEIYEKIVSELKALGHQVIAEHVVGMDYQEIMDQDDDKRVMYYKEMLSQINNADMVVAELTYSSASIGHEVTLAIEKNKPVLVLAKRDTTPRIFYALRDWDNLHITEYDKVEDLISILPDEIRQVKEGEDIRFNFLIPPSMVDYLEWVSKHRRVPKSVFIRNLIKRELESDEEFLKG